jgi:hypothetical protein
VAFLLLSGAPSGPAYRERPTGAYAEGWPNSHLLGLQGPARKIFIEFLERSCTAEFSGFLLYKELGRRLKKTNPVGAQRMHFPCYPWDWRCTNCTAVRHACKPVTPSKAVQWAPLLVAAQSGRMPAQGAPAKARAVCNSLLWQRELLQAARSLQRVKMGRQGGFLLRLWGPEAPVSAAAPQSRRSSRSCRATRRATQASSTRPCPTSTSRSTWAS